MRRGLTFRDAYGRTLVKAKLSDSGQAEYERRIAEVRRQPEPLLPEPDPVAPGGGRKTGNAAPAGSQEAYENRL